MAAALICCTQVNLSPLAQFLTSFYVYSISIVFFFFSQFSPILIYSFFVFTLPIAILFSLLLKSIFYSFLPLHILLLHIPFFLLILFFLLFLISSSCSSSFFFSYFFFFFLTFYLWPWHIHKKHRMLFHWRLAHYSHQTFSRIFYSVTFTNIFFLLPKSSSC